MLSYPLIQRIPHCNIFSINNDAMFPMKLPAFTSDLRADHAA
jgi:hypothetical protein